MSLTLTPEQTRALVKLGSRITGIPTLSFQGASKKLMPAKPTIPSIQRSKETPAKDLRRFLKDVLKGQ